MKWDEGEIAYLVKNYSSDLSLLDISSRLEKSRRAVLHKAARLGLSRLHSPVNKPKDPTHRSKIDRLYYLKNKEAIYKRKMDRRRALKEEVIKQLGGKCQNCNYNNSVAALDFHHKNDDKENNVTDLIKNSSKQSVFKEANKCIILCANCHRELHAMDASFNGRISGSSN